MPITNCFGPLLAFAVDRDSSDKAQVILNQAGFTFTLSDEEGYSHKTRKRAYSSQAQKSFSTYDERQQSGIVKALATYFWNDGLESRQRLIGILQAKGWSFNGHEFSGDTEGFPSAFFEKGQTHDAYIYIREVLQKAKNELGHN